MASANCEWWQKKAWQILLYENMFVITAVKILAMVSPITQTPCWPTRTCRNAFVRGPLTTLNWWPPAKLHTSIDSHQWAMSHRLKAVKKEFWKMQPIDRLLTYNGLASGQGRLNTVCANDLSLGSMYVLTAVLALHSSAQNMTHVSGTKYAKGGRCHPEMPSW